MAATFLGTTGNWGIPDDESGILITDLAFDFSNQEKSVLDKGGEVIGLFEADGMLLDAAQGLVRRHVPLTSASEIEEAYLAGTSESEEDHIERKRRKDVRKAWGRQRVREREDIELSDRAAPSRFLMKPFTLKQLAAKVKEVLP